MKGNRKYFKTFGGNLKTVQLTFNVIILGILATTSVKVIQTEPLLQISISNVLLGFIVVLVRSLTSDTNVHYGMAKLEFGLCSVSALLYVYFSVLIIPVGSVEIEFNVAIILGILTAILYATDAIDKITFLVFCDNQLTEKYQPPSPPNFATVIPPHQGINMNNL